MKNLSTKFTYLFLLAGLIFSSCSTKNFIVPEELIGEWQTEESKITVRIKPKGEKFQFIHGSGIISLTINKDKSVSGSIGDAIFKEGELIKNGGNPNVTGVAYIVKCGRVGKIFSEDPLDAKHVQIWMGIPDSKIDCELRYTEGMAHFPMSGFMLEKINK